MRAMALHTPAAIETNPLNRVEYPRPEPGAGEILVRVHTCRVCRTDLHVAEGDLSPKQPRNVPGQAVVGVVARLGDGRRRFARGPRAGVAGLPEPRDAR